MQLYSELRSNTYNKFIEYYTDLKNLDELKNLFESGYIAQEVIDVILRLVVHKNQYFTIYFIQKELPDLFLWDQDFSYYDFMDIYKFKEYLSPLELPIKLNKPYSPLLLKNKNESNLLALYLADQIQFKNVMDDDQKIIKLTKILKTPETEIKDEYQEETITKVFLKLKKKQELEGEFRSLGKSLYSNDARQKKLKLCSYENEIDEIYYNEILIGSTGIALFSENKVFYYNGDNLLKYNKYFYHLSKKINRVRLFFTSILCLVFLLSPIYLTEFVTKWFKAQDNGILSIIFVLLSYLFGIFFIRMLLNELFTKKQRRLYDFDINKANEDIGLPSERYNRILFKDLNKSDFFMDRYSIILNGKTLIFDIEEIIPKEINIKEFHNKRPTTHIEGDIDIINKDQELLLSNTEDSNQIARIKAETKKKINKFVEISYIIGLLENIKLDDLGNSPEKLNLENIISFCISLENKELNNYIIDTCNLKEIKLSYKNVTEFLSSGKCNRKILDMNLILEENLEAVEYILGKVKHTNEIHKVFVLNTLNKLNKCKEDDSTLVKLCNMTNINLMSLIKTNYNEFNAFLLDKIEDLINILGSVSSTIEIAEVNNADSRDIEIK